MESELKDYEQYLKEIRKYREDFYTNFFDKYTNNDSQDFLIDLKTLKVVGYKDKEYKIPSYGTLNSYYCEPAQRLLGELNNLQKEPLKCEEILEDESGIELSTDTSETAESSQESFTESSSDEGFAQESFAKPSSDETFGKKDFKVFRKHLLWRRKQSKLRKPNYTISRNPAFKQDTSYLDNIPVDDLSFGRSFLEL